MTTVVVAEDVSLLMQNYDCYCRSSLVFVLAFERPTTVKKTLMRRLLVHVQASENSVQRAVIWIRVEL